jgi:uncharacterized RDD family membrane protein YckC
MGTGVVEPLSPQQFCTECGRPYAVGDLVKFGDATICADCKPIFVQRMREGTPGSIGAVVYGGFWRRFAALLVDSTVVFYMVSPLFYLILIAFLVPAFKPGLDRPAVPPPAIAMLPLFVFLVFLIAPLFYNVYFTAKGGSTPGKMLLGLRIVTASGGPIGSGRAIGRLFARALSSVIFYIGDIMAAFDSQKRALHDRICDTRVIRIEPTLFGRRIGAFAIDMLVFVVFGWALLIAWHLWRGIPFIPDTTQTLPVAAVWRQYAQTWPPLLISWVFQMLYSVYFTSQKGATPGKMLAGLRVVTASGGSISVGRALGRYLSTTFLSQLLTLGIGLSLAAFDPQCRALEDRICKTRVVRGVELPVYPS